MNTINIELDRLHLNIHGVSSHIVEEAIPLLKEQLRRRVGGLELMGLSSLDVSELSLSPINENTRLDSEALSGLIADRLIAAIFR